MPPQSQQQEVTVRPEPRRQRVTPGRRVRFRFRFCVHVAIVPSLCSGRLAAMLPPR